MPDAVKVNALIYTQLNRKSTNIKIYNEFTSIQHMFDALNIGIYTQCILMS